MAVNANDKIILSYNDSCLYKSDLLILKSETDWLSDRIISFYFEFLYYEFVDKKEDILLIGKKMY